MGLLISPPLFAAVVVNTCMRDVIRPILPLPIASPILIVAEEMTNTTFPGGNWEEIANWFEVVLVFTVVYLVATAMLFDYIVEA